MHPPTTSDTTTDDAPPRPRNAVFAAMLGLTALSSLLPSVLAAAGVDTIAYYPWTFSPILPLCLYGAAFLRHPAAAFLVPLAGCLVQAVTQAAWTGRLDYGFSPALLWVAAGLAAATWIGFFLRRDRHPLRIAATGLGGGLAFFAVSNLGVWLGGGYGYSLAGLAECFLMAVPFFRGVPLSLLVFLPVLFSPAALRGAAGERHPVRYAGDAA